MRLITNILKRANQLRYKGAEDPSLSRDPLPNKQKGKRSIKKWGLISAGLISVSILLFVLVKNFVSPHTTRPDQASTYPIIAEKESPKPPKEGGVLPKDENPQTSDQTLNRATPRRSNTEGTSYEGIALESRPPSQQGEKKVIESKPSFREKKQPPLIKEMPKEEVPSKVVEVKQEGEMDIPIGVVLSQGNVMMEVKDKVWRTVESPYAPILKGKKVKTEKGTARISLSNNSLIEMSEKSIVSFDHEGQLNLLEGEIHFRIPSTAQMNFKIGALSVTKAHSPTPQAGLTTNLPGDEETRGSLFLHSDGSLSIRPVQGSLSILDHKNRVLTTTSSREPITISPKIVSGEETWRVVQQAGSPKQEMEITPQAPLGTEGKKVDDLEKYLIDFSIHLKGKKLPANLNTQKFFSLLESVYPHRDIIEKVKQYPIKVRKEGESYVLVLCDKESKWMLYKDNGKTTHMVDYIPWSEGLRVRCHEASPFYWALAIQTPAAGVLLWLADDHKDSIPLCP